MQLNDRDQRIPVSADSSCVDVQRISLESAVRQAAEAIVITSATGKIQYVNPAFTRITGYEPDDVIGETPRILKSGQQDPAHYERLWKTISAGRGWRGELINRRKDGTLFTEKLSITPVLNSLGRPSNYIAVGQDVTERRAAEAARQFLAAIVESTDAAVVGSTLDGKILTWNRGAEKLYGYLPADAIGRPFSILLAREYQEQGRRILEGLLRGKFFPQMESVALRKNGERMPVSLSVCLIRNAEGHPTGSAAIIRDIAKAKQAEKALRDSEARFRTAFEHAPFGLSLTTADSRILQANGTFCRMLGYSAAELTALGWVRITHPDDQTRSQLVYEHLVQDSSASIDIEKRYIHKDGRVIHVRLCMSVVETEGTFQFVSHIEQLPEPR